MVSTLIRRASEHPLWRKGVFFSPRNFRHDAYVAGYGSAMLNAAASVMSVEQLLAADYRPTTELFVRPIDDSKTFTGRSLRFSECEQLLRQPQASGLDLVVGEVYDIDAEYRLFVVGAKVVAGSMYRPSAERTLPSELIQFAERAARMQLLQRQSFLRSRCHGRRPRRLSLARGAMVTSPANIRAAEPRDRHQILLVHTAAIRELCAGHLHRRAARSMGWSAPRRCLRCRSS
jgi:hypothetical protein